MGEAPIANSRSNTTIFLAHSAAFLLWFLLLSGCAASPCSPTPFFKAICRSLAGFSPLFSPPYPRPLPGNARPHLTDSRRRISSLRRCPHRDQRSLFPISPRRPLRLLWAPIAWWLGRLVLALLLVVALLVEHFLPRSRHPRGEIAGALLAVIALTYVLAAALRGLPRKSLGIRERSSPIRSSCCPAPFSS